MSIVQTIVIFMKLIQLRAKICSAFNRKNTLTITKDGITALNQIHDSIDRQIVQLFSHLTNEEVLNVKNYMNKIQEYLEK